MFKDSNSPAVQEHPQHQFVSVTHTVAGFTYPA